MTKWDGSYPRSVIRPHPGRAHSARGSKLLRMSATTEATLWICESCGFIYDPAIGDPDGGIPPGTAFEEIPKDWFCPVCGARTSDFRPLEPGEA